MTLAEQTAAVRGGIMPPPPISDSGPPLRTRAVDLALAGDGPAPAALLAGDAASALTAWFGPRVAGFDRRRILQALDRDIAALDRLLGEQVNAILHHPRLQRLEALWRGVQFLCGHAEAYDKVKIRLLDITWPEVCRDLERAADFDQSQLFQKIYEEEFGMPGGEPFGILVGDYQVSHRRNPPHNTDDVAALKGMAQIAAAAFCPFVVGAAPALFGADSFTDLAAGSDLTSAFRGPDYARWRSLQDGEDARFIGVTLPHVLMRLPYGHDQQRPDGFRFAEDTSRRGDYLWGHAGFAFASVVMRAFGLHGWFAEIRGTERDRESGGLVTGLPVHCFATDRRGLAIKYSTDLSLSEEQEKQLSDLGFVPLMKCKDTDYSAFYSNSSLQSPRVYDRAVATANARLSAMLQYIFCVSRFAHYIKVLGRDRTGSFATPDDCEVFLNKWLVQFVTGNDDASPSLKARFPLREASVQVREAPGRPGVYLSVIHLKPHYQLDQVVSAFRLTTEVARKN